MKISTVFALSVAILSAATVMRASVPIIVATPARMRAAMEFVTDAQDQLKKGTSPVPGEMSTQLSITIPLFGSGVRAGADFVTRGQIRSRS